MKIFNEMLKHEVDIAKEKKILEAIYENII